MNKRRIIAMAITVGTIAGALALAPRPARAAEDAEAGVIYQKKTTINFEEDTIDGDLTKPDAAYVESRKRVRHTNLIRIREDFREKVLASVSGL